VSLHPVLLPEEEELARLKARPSDLEEELADEELNLVTLRRQLAEFELRYLAVVGRRMAELDRIEAEIAAVLALLRPSSQANEEAEQTSHRAQESRAALGDDPDALAEVADEPPREIPPELKKLYRAVAKAVHPDLATDEEDRTLREQLDVGLITAVPGTAKALAAKARIAKLLDIEISSVEILKSKMDMSGGGLIPQTHVRSRCRKELQCLRDVCLCLPMPSC
jgi:hypothetical protein